MSKGSVSLHSVEEDILFENSTLRWVVSLSRTIAINKHTPTNLTVDPKDEIKFIGLIESG